MDNSPRIFTPNEAAGYYAAVLGICICILFAIPHQFFLARRYFYPKETKHVSLDHSNNENTVKTANSGELIHSSFVVNSHKFWNTRIHVHGIGNMSMKEVVMLIIYLSLNAAFLFIPFEASLTHDIVQRNNRFGRLGFANGAFVFAMATRNSVFVNLLGVPFERMIIFHRWVGRTIIFMIMFHGGSQISNRWNTMTHNLYDLFFADRVIRAGFISFLGLAIIGITSISLIRRYAFEVFYFGHLGYIVFLTAVCLHDSQAIYWFGFGIALYGIDRIIRFFVSWKETKVISVKALQGGVTKIGFKRKWNYQPGQYIFVNFSQLNLFSTIDWHPVSLSSAPTLTDDGQSYATIHLKTSGGFTKRLFNKAQDTTSEKETTFKMRVEGPYGKPSVNFKDYRTVLLVGGGIGVTPIMSIIQDLVDRQVTGVPLKTQLIFFVWIIPDLDAYSWFEMELEELSQRFSILSSETYRLDLKIYLTRDKGSLPTNVIQGRPNFTKLLHEIKNLNGSGDIAVAACGPALLLNEVSRTAISQSDRTCLFKVHTEVFEF
ncbi:hypothetical protein G9A89_010646 [Geosiphon pyriformis]|nr:hypothetical protein G9A89_010646 [Geosiphon pyriformis]